MKKILIVPLVIISLAAGYFIATYEPLAKAALIEGNESHVECQYPTRPLVNGRCDNNEPAVVESEPSQPIQPVVTPEIPTTNTCKK